MQFRVEDHVLAVRFNMAMRAADHAEQTRLCVTVKFGVRESECAAVGPQNHQADNEPEVANAIHDECFVGSHVCGMAFGVKADQQKAADADQFPEHEDLENVAREDKTKHREAEERHEREETIETSRTMDVLPVTGVSGMIDVLVGQFVRHVTDGEDVDTRRDQRHHHEHQQREAVDVVINGDFQITERSQPVNRP